MRAQVTIPFIENFKKTTQQKSATAENPSDLVTSISFNCKMNPITALRLESLLKQGAALDCSITARQASFDWQADPNMDIIRKISETQPEETAIPASTLAPAEPTKSFDDNSAEAVTRAEAVANIEATGAGIMATPKSRITYDNTGKEESVCPGCALKDTPECEAPVSFRDCVTSCTGRQESPAGAADLKTTEPEAVKAPAGNGNGHKEKTRYIPGQGRRKTAKAG